MNQPVIRALVVDDSALYRKFVRSVLEAIPEVEVVGTASNGRIGLEKIDSLKPDLITLDLEMPELDGIGMLREMSARSIKIPTIMISSLTAEGAKSTNTALQLGAFDFVLKPIGKSPEESRIQLQSDLTPKIRACVSQRKRKPFSVPASRPVQTTKNAVRKMTDRIGTIRRKPKVLGIGVSTGGPVALTQLMPHLPANFPCPILIVQHMPPMFTKSLAKDLNRISKLEVQEATDGMVALPGQALIAPGGKQMRVSDEDGKPTIHITDDSPERNCRPSVDYLFRSIAQHYGDQAVAAILTGMGDDGTEGCKLMKKAGAAILAQDEESCVVYGMPRSVFEAGLTDRVASLSEMSECLQRAVGLRGIACQV